jgi:hypothetical protein
LEKYGRPLSKRPSALTVASVNGFEALIVADKSGDAYALSTPDITSKKKFLFGHTNSIITDLVCPIAATPIV